MGRRDRISIIVMLVAGFSLVGIPAANAYVDPGAGSFIFQAIVGGLLAATLALKVFWRRIAAMVSGRQTSDEQSAPEPSTTGTED